MLRSVRSTPRLSERVSRPERSVPAARNFSVAPKQYTVPSVNIASTASSLFNYETLNSTFATNTITKRFYSTSVETIKVPQIADSISEGSIQDWLKQEGEFVKEDDVIVQIETDKVVVDVRAPTSGVLVKRLANPGDTVEVGQDLYQFDKSATQGTTPASPAVATAGPTKTPETPKPASSAGVPKTPEAPKPAAKTEIPTPQQAAQFVGRKGTEGLERRVKMTRMRQRIAQRLKESQNTYAMLTTFNEVDMSALMELRGTYKEAFEKKHGIKFGFMSAFVKAASAALEAVPEVNAVIDGDEIVYRDYTDIGVAVSTPTGLVVPVVRNCQEKSMADIEREIGELGKKGRDGKITIDDMQGGTFTISNGGVFGSLMGTPIINPPQSAILGMHAIKKRAVVVNDKVEVRPMMYLALTYDHRLIDGKEAVTFLVKIKDLIEDPRRLLLDL